MAGLPNPSINPPKLPLPAHAQSLPRASPSPTPSVRRAHTIAQDPILRNLSPTKTLRALNASSPTQHTDIEVDLMKSLQNVSATDREFGVRVAQTCKDLREWATEVEAWEWPGTFEPPSRQERPLKRRKMLMDHHVRDSFFEDDTEDQTYDGFWGSLPKELVQAYEIRIDEIHQAMEDLDVEGLKNRVRSVHILPKSIQTKDQDEYVSFKVGSVDDFTTLITATILQALPYMSWLSRLLNEWSVRLQVLRKVPGFLAGLEDTHQQLEAAYSDLSSATHGSRDLAGSARLHFESTQKVLSSKVSGLGQRLDSMLDELEGRSETLPDRWIDAFESLELTYSNYVIKAERTLTELAWEFDLASSQSASSAAPPGVEGLGIVTEPQSNQNTPRQTQQPTPAFPTPAVPATIKGQLNESQPVRVIGKMPSRERVESPLLGQRAWRRDNSVVSVNQPVQRLQQDSAYTRFMDDVIAESLDQDDTPDGLPLDAAQAHDHIPTAHGTQEAEQPKPPSPAKSAKSPRLRPRHVPINVEPYRHDPMPSVAGSAVDHDSRSSHDAPSLPTPPQDERRPTTSRSTLSLRKSFFGGDADKKTSPKRDQSPAKTNEHNPTGLSRFFKPATQIPARTKSNSSRKTLRKKASKHHKSGSASSKWSAEGPVLPTASPRASKRDSSGTISNISAALKRVSVQETADNSPVQQAPPSTSPQNVDWSDKEVVLAWPSTEAGSTPRAMYDSPFDNARYSGQWPLGSNAKSIPKPSSPGAPIRTDAFEQMFVDTLPTSPIVDDDSYTMNLMAFDNYINQLRALHGIGEPIEQDTMADGVYRHALQDTKHGGSLGERSAAAKGHNRQGSDDTSLQQGYETSSALASNISVADIEHASPVTFVRPQMVHNKRSSREGSQVPRPANHEPIPLYAPVAIKQPSLDRILSDEHHNQPYQSQAANRGTRDEPSTDHSHVQTSAPRTDMRNKASDASLSSNYDALPHGGRTRSDTSKSAPAFPMPPGYSLPNHTRNRSEKDSRSILQALRSDSERSIVGTKLGAAKPRPLTLVTATIPERVSQSNVPRQIDSTNTAAPAMPIKSARRRSNATANPGGDYIDQHISKVLQNMTSTIHFDPTAVSSGAFTGHVTSKAAPLMSNPPAPRRASRNLMLVPANTSEPSLKRHIKDGETKLYHLSQPGREQPIKLFVRLVGEEERVMVRVGGGWMDLEEYLRQYAEHHPHRTVSGNQIEVNDVSRPALNERRSSAKYDKRRSGGIFSDSEQGLGIYQQAGQVPQVPSLPVSPLEPSSASTAFSSNPDERTPVSATTSTPFFGIGHAPTPPTLSYLDSRSPPGSPPLLGARLDPLRSNPTFSPLTSMGDTAQNSSRPASMIPAADGPRPAVSRESMMSESMVTAINGNFVPRGEEGNGGGALSKAGIEAQKAKWVEDMIARAKESASAKKVGDRASRTHSGQDLASVGATTRISMADAVAGAR